MSTFEELYLDPLEQRIDGRLDALEQRIGKIEDTLNLVLKHLGIATDESHDEPRSAIQLPPKAKSGSYEFHPLDASFDEIRLLAVYNSDDEDGLVNCRLVSARLTEDDSGALYDGELAEFKTLSYAWGDSTATRVAVVDGHEFPVTQNLDAALRSIRKQNPRPENEARWRPTFWWIDALCINQNDVSERSRQVNLMTRIYRKATGVHIWLGEENEDSDLAMSLVRQLGETSQQGPGVQGLAYPDVSEEQRAAHWKALIALLERSWWARVWVRQEVAVAKQAVVHCGNQQCDFAALAATANILSKVDETLGSGSFLLNRALPEPANGVLIASPYTRASVLAEFRSSKGKRPNLTYRDLGDLIIHTRSCAATDVRDKVFSMLGLLDPTLWELRADYSVSIKEALMSAARCIISKKQSLDIMAAGQNPQQLHNLASWAPNLIDSWTARPFGYLVSPQLGIVPAGEDHDFTFEGENSEILKARGCRLGTVAKVYPDTPGQDWSDDELTKLSTTWKVFASTAFSKNQGGFMDRGAVKQYQEDEGAWIRFVSAGADHAMPEPISSTPLGLDGNHRYELVKSLLMEKQDVPEQSSPEFVKLKNRTLQALRKFAVGRRLCVTDVGDDKGSVVLVPMDTKPGDQIWMFRGTRSPFVLRKIEKETYVAVGEAYCTSYIFINESTNEIPFRTISIY